MSRLNCWDFMDCGLELGGRKTDLYGVCPAAQENRLDGIHGGENAGRACWVLSGTLCEGVPQGGFIDKFRHCAHCDFYQTVRVQEGEGVALNSELLDRLG